MNSTLIRSSFNGIFQTDDGQRTNLSSSFDIRPFELAIEVDSEDITNEEKISDTKLLLIKLIESEFAIPNSIGVEVVRYSDPPMLQFYPYYKSKSTDFNTNDTSNIQTLQRIYLDVEDNEYYRTSWDIYAYWGWKWLSSNPLILYFSDSFPILKKTRFFHGMIVLPPQNDPNEDLSEYDELVVETLGLDDNNNEYQDQKLDENMQDLNDEINYSKRQGLFTFAVTNADDRDMVTEIASLFSITVLSEILVPIDIYNEETKFGYDIRSYLILKRNPNTVFLTSNPEKWLRESIQYIKRDLLPRVTVPLYQNNDIITMKYAVYLSIRDVIFENSLFGNLAWIICRFLTFGEDYSFSFMLTRRDDLKIFKTSFEYNINNLKNLNRKEIVVSDNYDASQLSLLYRLKYPGSLIIENENRYFIVANFTIGNLDDDDIEDLRQQALIWYQEQCYQSPEELISRREYTELDIFELLSLIEDQKGYCFEADDFKKLGENPFIRSPFSEDGYKQFLLLKERRMGLFPLGPFEGLISWSVLKEDLSLENTDTKIDLDVDPTEPLTPGNKFTYQVYAMLNNFVRRDLFDFILDTDDNAFEVLTILQVLWQQGLFLSPWSKVLLNYENRVSHHVAATLGTNNFLFRVSDDINAGPNVLQYLRNAIE